MNPPHDPRPPLLIQIIPPSGEALSRWRHAIEEEIRKWTRDPNYIGVLPAEVQHVFLLSRTPGFANLWRWAKLFPTLVMCALLWGSMLWGIAGGVNDVRTPQAHVCGRVLLDAPPYAWSEGP